MRYEIIGDNLQYVSVELEENEAVTAESGAMVYMSGNMNIETKAKGGMFKGLKRKMTGESFFQNTYRPTGGTGLVAFAGNAPGKIKALDIQPGQEVNLQKGGYVAATEGIEQELTRQKKIGAAVFGGEGFWLQKIAGQGTCWIHACGDFVEFDLNQGQTMKVDNGSVVAWDRAVDYGVERVGGLKSTILSGEGFVASLTGPGKIICQSMTLRQLAGALIPFMPKK
ncbi:MAG: TIGR00266 family protein [Thermoplasmata archaeon]